MTRKIKFRKSAKAPSATDSPRFFLALAGVWMLCPALAAAAPANPQGIRFHTPDGCADLLAPGVWEPITPPGETFTISLVVDPFDPSTVWLGAGKGFYKSTDCGATWTRRDGGITGLGGDLRNFWSLAADPVDAGTLYVAGGYAPRNLWKTVDGGVNWQPLFPAGSEGNTVFKEVFINNVAMDPTDHRHLTVTVHGECNAPYNPHCMGESFDGGATWRIFRIPFAWVEGGGGYLVDGSTLLMSDPWGSMNVSTDNGATWSDAGSGAQGQTNGPLAKAPDGFFYQPSLFGIVRSADGRSWSHVPGVSGRHVGFTMGGGYLFLSDQWSTTYRMASVSDPTTWATIPPPAPLPADQGSAFISYDPVHRVLYSSNFAGGTWRIVIP